MVFSRYSVLITNSLNHGKRHSSKPIATQVVFPKICYSKPIYLLIKHWKWQLGSTQVLTAKPPGTSTYCELSICFYHQILRIKLYYRAISFYLFALYLRSLTSFSYMTKFGWLIIVVYLSREPLQMPKLGTLIAPLSCSLKYTHIKWMEMRFKWKESGWE